MAFDPNVLLDLTVDTANDTKVIPCPEGEFQGQIDSVKPRTWQSKDGTTSGVTLDVTWEILDEGVKETCDREKVTVRQGIMLDMKADGALDMGKGKNVGLGRLREALNMNTPGVPFSFRNLVGQVAVVSVTHRAGDGDDIFPEIRSVAPLS